MAYFNYTTYWATDWWSRRAFVHAWWQLNADDPRWLPPDYVAWRRLIVRAEAPYWRRIGAQPVHLEALPRRRQSAYAPNHQPLLAGAVFEQPVAAAVLLCEAETGAAYLSMFHCANDEETLERLIGAVMERAAEAGCMRLVAPAGPLPAWGGGALLNHFNLPPPLHTPYTPPYLADLLATSMEARQRQVLLTLPVTADAPASGPAVLRSLALSDLAGAHLPLLAAALAPHSDMPVLSADAAALLLQWIGVYPVSGWLAEVNDAPAGFVVVQPDLAPLVRRTGGGRWLPWRWYGAWARRRPARRGRLLLGAVAPAMRRRGVGSQLLAQAQRHAAAAGWAELVCGPYTEDTPVVDWLQRAGARVQQQYALFEWNG
ncbi:MAG TPA: GNAT family N-acetyltransferase [Chloroflexi bacterium]|nr:GNAT family N-acetyltransferase [Chloroflexota bacterium]